MKSLRMTAFCRGRWRRVGAFERDQKSAGGVGKGIFLVPSFVHCSRHIMHAVSWIRYYGIDILAVALKKLSSSI